MESPKRGCDVGICVVKTRKTHCDYIAIWRLSSCPWLAFRSLALKKGSVLHLLSPLRPELVRLCKLIHLLSADYHTSLERPWDLDCTDLRVMYMSERTNGPGQRKLARQKRGE